MDSNVIYLEQVRQNLESLASKRGCLMDVLDGHVSAGHVFTAAERASLNQQDAECSRQFAAQEADIHEFLSRLRAQASPAIAEWVGLHQSILRRIVAKSGRPVASALGSLIRWARDPLGWFPGDNRVRLREAQITLAKWDLVLKGELDYVVINACWLGDYDRKMIRWLKRARQ